MGCRGFPDLHQGTKKARRGALSLPRLGAGGKKLMNAGREASRNFGISWENRAFSASAPFPRSRKGRNWGKFRSPAPRWPQGETATATTTSNRLAEIFGTMLSGWDLAPGLNIPERVAVLHIEPRSSGLREHAIQILDTRELPKFPRPGIEQKVRLSSVDPSINQRSRDAKLRDRFFRKLSPIGRHELDVPTSGLFEAISVG